MAQGPFYQVGLHVGEVMSQDIVKASTGTTQFVLEVKILGVPDGEHYKPHSQQFVRKIFWAATSNTTKFVLEKMERLGFDEAPSQWHPAAPRHQSLKGMQVDLWCSHETGLKGGAREKWDIAKGESTPSEALTPKDSRELDALFGKARATQPRGPQAASRTSTVQRPLADELEEETGISPQYEPKPEGTKHNFGFKNATQGNDELPPVEAYEEDFPL